MGCCPFHRETKPSFRVNLDKRVFHCFGCEAKGNVLDFVARKEETTIKDAALLLAEWFNLEIGNAPEHLPKKKAPTPLEKETEPAPPAPTNSDATINGNRPLTFTLQLDSEHPYLKDRGVGPETIKVFGLGFCSRGLMKGRVVIPIHDEKGNLVAYAGRWPGDELPEGEEKYKLPAGFKKNRVLFNLHRVADAEHLALVEGYWSVFRLHQLGIPAVALMGRTLSTEQEELLAKTAARRLTLLMDGDEPGRLAQAELIPRLAKRLFLRAVNLPQGGQPDTLEEAVLLKLLGDR